MDILVKASIIDKDMMSLAVVLKYAQESSRARRGRTRQRGDTRRKWDGVELFEQI